jgi:hypothetical protein
MATVAVPITTCKTLISELYGTDDHTGAAHTTRPEPLPEAAFSLTIKGTIGGHEAMLTVRGQTASAFQINVTAVRGILDPQTPTVQAQTTPPASEATPEGWCAAHNVPMSKQSNQRGSWYSHKTDVGSWCKGK